MKLNQTGWMALGMAGLLAAGGSPSTWALPPPSNPNVFVETSRQVVPSVVNIFTFANPRSRQFRGAPDEFFRHFFGVDPEGDVGMAPRGRPGPRSGQAGLQPVSLGTGFVIDSSGLILTNNHVIANADEIKVKFTENPAEEPVTAKKVGADPELDVAVLQVKGVKDLKALNLGNSDSLDVGEYVMAVGNPFGQGHSVTHGIISAKGRISPDMPLASYLQTDAPINPGNSGGPLVNLKGDVIGINNAIDARAQGIGFAIPINSVKAVLGQLKDKGKVSRGYLGIQIEPMRREIAKQLGVPEDTEGALVGRADLGGPAFQAGIRPYDVILEIAGKKVRNPSELVAAVAGTPAGEKVEIKVRRGGDVQQLRVKLGDRPSS